MSPYQSTAGDIIALDNQKAGALRLSTSLGMYAGASTDPVVMFARRDAFRTVAESIASSMAGVPLDLYARDAGDDGRSRIRAGEHPVATALEAPSPGMTQFRLLEGCALDAVLHDRWAIVILEEESGLQFVRLPAQWISFAVDGYRRITDVLLYRPDRPGRPFPIPIERVLFDVGYDPSPSGSTTSGYSISHTLEASATELEQGAAYRAQLLAKGPRIPMYVHRPKDAAPWKPDSRSAFEQSFRSFADERAGEVPVLEDGMELRPTPQLVQDAVQYRETRLAAQIEFAIALHFPPELVGYRQGTFSNIAALRELLYVDTLGTRLYAVRQAWNAGLRRAGLIDPSLEYVEENVAIRLAGNPELQAQILQTQVGAPIRTVNEARRLLNLPPIPGGDELIVPLNVIKGGLASPRDTGPKALEVPRQRVLLAGSPSSSKATPSAYLTRIEKQRDRFAGDLERALKAQAKRVREGLGSGDSAGDLDGAFDLNLEAAELESVILPHTFAIAAAGAAIVLDQYNPDREGFSDEVMLPWLQTAAATTAALIAGGMFRDVAARIVQPGWADELAAYYEAATTGTSSSWATTLTTASREFGQQDAAKASGLTQKTWIHVGGATSRADHEALDGETVSIEDVFSNGLRWPGDPSGTAEDNAECRCRLEYSIAGS